MTDSNDANSTPQTGTPQTDIEGFDFTDAPDETPFQMIHNNTERATQRDFEPGELTPGLAGRLDAAMKASNPLRGHGTNEGAS
jgi:hypothetical protein